MGKGTFARLLLHLGLASTACTTAAAHALHLFHEDNSRALAHLHKRVVADAPNGYVPTAVDCPSTRPVVRSAADLSEQEQDWLEKRRPNIIDPLRAFLTRINITGFDAGAYIDANRNNLTQIPNIGIALSGGGYRALMNGAGVLAAFDERTRNSTSPGHLGGLLQSATYTAGLSGGGWLVGSLSLNNFTSVQAILDSDPDVTGSLWQFQDSLFAGPSENDAQNITGTAYYSNIIDSVNAKRDAGYNTSITDLWGRALGYQLIAAPQGGLGFTWSSLAEDPSFKEGEVPMPILVADGRAPGEKIIALNATVFEFNPWELGTWDPTVFGFAPLRYVGSNFTNGRVAQDQQCVRGFDSAQFVMGTSSSLFNQFIFYIDSVEIPTLVRNILEGVLDTLGQENNDIADWTPNPFYRWNPSTNPSARSKRLTLVDGGEDLQNIPLYPLIQPERNVDVIFAVDSSADTAAPGANWPNGTAMVASYERAVNFDIQNGTTFPHVPDTNTFVNLGLNTRPTFFGCDPTNFTGDNDHIPPLIVYLPNFPYIYNSNVSTFNPSYNITERNAIIENGYLVATRGNSTQDADWPQCVGCAVMSRVWSRQNATVPQICQQCFDRYCWDGRTESNTPAEPYEPTSVFTQVDVQGSAALIKPGLLAGIMVMGVMAMMA